MQTVTKQPNDVLDYDVDMTAWFASIPGDDIQSVSFVITTLSETVPSLVLGPVPHPTHVLMGAPTVVFKVWLGGGTAYEDYVVTCMILTAQDRTKEFEFRIKVRDL